jgi:DNA repair exonuclease SbcCD ATPase subunit
MGDNAEFEKLTTLEARLAAALDRIAVGLGEMPMAPPMEDPALTSGAFEDLQLRAEAAEARVAELEAELAAQGSGDAEAVGDDLTAERDAALARAAALEAAREADRDEAQRALAARDAEIAELRAARDAAPAADATDSAAEIDALKAQVAELEGKVTRLRAERAEAFAERDEARDIAEELQAASGMSPDDRAMALRAEAQELRVINERLAKNIDRLRGENATDPKTLNKALLVELDALKAIRASEAAELTRILSELEQDGTGESGHA